MIFIVHPLVAREAHYGVLKLPRVDRLNGIAEQFLMVQFAENTQVCEPLSHKEFILIHTVGLNASTLYVRFRGKLGVVLIILS